MGAPWEDYATESGPWDAYAKPKGIEPFEGDLAVGSPKHRRDMEQFIRKEGKRDIKREFTRALPMVGQKIDEAYNGTYNDPVRPDRTVNRILGPDLAPSTGGAMVKGLSQFVTDPERIDRSIAGAIEFPAKMAIELGPDIIKGLSGNLDASKRLQENIGGMTNFTGIPDIMEGNITTMPKAREAWQESPLESALMMYSAGRGVKTISDTTTRSLGTVAKAGIRAMTKPDTAADLYRSALKPTNVPSKQVAVNAAIERGLDTGTVVNRSGTGLEKVVERLDAKEMELQGILEPSTQSINVGALDKSLDGLRNAAFDDIMNRDTIHNAANEYIQSMREHPTYNPATDSVPIQTANTIKRKLYKSLSKNSAYDTGQILAGKGTAAKAFAKSIMQSIENAIPEIGPLNKKLGSDLNLQKYLSRAVARIQNTDVLGIRARLAIIAGVAAPKYVAASLVSAIIDNPSFKSRMAIALHRIHKGRLSTKATKELIDELPVRILKAAEEERRAFNPETPGQPDIRNVGETIPGRNAYDQPSLEEGGMPGFRSGTPEGFNPEVTPGKQSSYTDQEMVPQGNTNVDLMSMTTKLKELGFTDEQIGEFIPKAMKAGAPIAAVTAYLVADDETKKRMLQTLPMLAMIDPYAVKANPGKNSIFKRDVYAKELLNGQGTKEPWMKHANNFPPPETYGIDVNQTTKAGHTSPHIFTDMDIYGNLKTGEGATYYGPGHYSHTNESIKSNYTRTLSPKAAKRTFMKINDELIAASPLDKSLHDSISEVNKKRTLEYLAPIADMPEVWRYWKAQTMGTASGTFQLKNPQSFLYLTHQSSSGNVNAGTGKWRIKIHEGSRHLLSPEQKYFLDSFVKKGRVSVDKDLSLRDAAEKMLQIDKDLMELPGNKPYELKPKTSSDGRSVMPDTFDVRHPGAGVMTGGFRNAIYAENLEQATQKFLDRVEQRAKLSRNPTVEKANVKEELENLGFIVKQRAIQYEETLPNEQLYAKWDKPLNEQPKYVQDRLQHLYDQLAPPNNPSAFTFDKIFTGLTRKLGSDVKASRYLESLGLAGWSVPAANLSNPKPYRNFITVANDLVNIDKISSIAPIVGLTAAELYNLLLDPSDDAKKTLAGLPIMMGMLASGAKSQSLKPAVIRKGEVLTAPLGKTHYDVKEIAKGIDTSGTEKIVGFVTPDGKFLDRKQSLEWLKENDSEAYRKLDKTTREKGLESMSYAHVKGASKSIDAEANAFMKRQFGSK